jgi:hypothetical protein
MPLDVKLEYVTWEIIAWKKPCAGNGTASLSLKLFVMISLA